MKRSLATGLQVAMGANADAYRRAVQTSAPGECWDYVVLTAANEKQAAGYRRELALRQRAVGPTAAFFPAIQRSLVVADPPGRRAGSGGATLAVMRELAAQHGVDPGHFERLRILLIHSGGASQRLPAYSPLGKIFAPLPLLRPDGQIATLFDHLYVTLAGLPERLGPGMLVMAGDVFLLFDHRQVSRPTQGVTALTMRVDAEMGRGHGVFAIDAKQQILHTLQKVSVETMRQQGATDAAGRVLIDTGLLFFDGQRSLELARLAGAKPAGRGKAKRGLDQRYPVQIDLYEDMTAALARGTARGDFLRNTSLPAVRKALWSALHGTPFGVMQLDGEFLHLGTTRQFRDAMVGNDAAPAAELFQHNVLTHSDWPIGAGRRVYHSVLLSDGKNAGTLGSGSVVEHSILRGAASIGAGSVVSQVVALRRPLVLGDDLLLFQVPVRESEGKSGGMLRFVHVLCGVEDDFKGRFGDGVCRYLNRPFDEWLKRHGVQAGDIWPRTAGAQRTLWTARLFSATESRDAADTVAWLPLPKRASTAAVRRWKQSPRYSMAMILEGADPQALIEHRELVSAYLQTTQLLDSIKRREDSPIASRLGHYASEAAYQGSEQLLTDWAQRTPRDADQAIDQARALCCVTQLLRRPDHPAGPMAAQRIEPIMQQVFAKVVEASEIGYRSIEVGPTHSERLRPNVSIVATSPVRLDLAGGWTDTPPYCFERGGHVVNVAIDLDGRPPVRVAVRTTREPTIVLESHDLGQTEVIDASNADTAASSDDVHDPFALHKVALNIMGLLPASAGKFASHMKTLGAGLHVTSECRVPKGSGLGTSSILAATMLAALAELRGQERSPLQLIERTLVLEQRLSTGGGWQDQVGGVVGGIKSTVSAAGVPQRPVIEALALSDRQYAALEDRLVVYYSGQQRLARDILRRVMGRWLEREPAVLQLMAGLRAGAAGLRATVLKGQWSAAARHVNQYWQIKKELYPRSTTPPIDVLFLELKAHYLAAGLAGAGGGGFAYFVCKDRRQSDRLRQMLSDAAGRPGNLGRVFDTQINRLGLTVARG